MLLSDRAVCEAREGLILGDCASKCPGLFLGFFVASLGFDLAVSRFGGGGGGAGGGGGR